jgi:CheY-like chemotaxis protein
MAEAQILVVDDEVGMVTLLRNYLTREGYAVTTAPSAEVALQALQEHDIDVVLTDLRMPGMGGMELVREKPGHDIRYLGAELTGSYPVGTSSKSHNCCTGTGQCV